jgi:hypothetical protein
MIPTKTFHINHFKLTGGGHTVCEMSDIVVLVIEGGQPGGPVQTIFHATMEITSLGWKSGDMDPVIVNGPGGTFITTTQRFFVPAPMFIEIDFKSAGGGEIDSNPLLFKCFCLCGDNKRTIEFSGRTDKIADFDLINECHVFAPSSHFCRC